MKDKAQQQLNLFGPDFDKLVDERGVSGALIELESRAKREYNAKPLSASERAKAEREIRRIVREATQGEKELTTAQVIAVGRQISQARGLYAHFLDLEQDHGHRLWPSEKNLKEWAKHPGRKDLIGVDTKERTATAGKEKGRTYRGLFGMKYFKK